ncbi:hypothetical protein UlMin_031346 [Ulmus minor]
MDRLVKPDVKEVELSFKNGQKCSATFRLTNLMHTMTVAVSLSTTNPNVLFFSSSQAFSIIPPLSSASYTLWSNPLDQPLLVAPHDVINVRSAMLPTGKAHLDDLRRLFSAPGRHVFRDASLPIAFVGPQVVEYLISHNTNIQQLNSSSLSKAISGCSESQLTALLKPAIDSGNADLLFTLIDAGAQVNGTGSFLSIAVRTGNAEIVKGLIASGCKIVSSVDWVLHEAAAMNRVDLIEILCRSFPDIDINSVDSDGRAPIHIAAGRGHVEVLKFLLSVGANAETLDNNGGTALHCASAEGQFEAAKCLIECSNTKNVVNKQGKTPFATAAENGHSKLLGVLHLNDALHRAARIDDVLALKNCIAEGATVNEKDQNGWTPLHRAAFKGRIECIRVLLNHGAHVDAADDYGYTPLHCAAEAGHVQVAMLLIAHGAKANVKSLEGVVPLNLDRFKNHPALVQVQPLCHDSRE